MENSSMDSTYKTVNATAIENMNSSTTVQPPFFRPEWLVCEVILCLLTLFSIYVFINTIRYAVKKKNSPGRDMSGKQGRQLHIMLIMASGFTTLRIFGDQAVAFISWKDGATCLTTITVSTVLFALSLISVYVFLWMRQSIFYSNPVLKKVLNKAVTFFSWSTLFVMLISGVCLTVLYSLPEVTGWTYIITDKGCFEESSQTLELVPTVTLGTTIYFQVTLLGLFLYPLLSRKTQRYRSAAKSTNGNGGPGNNSNSQPPSSVSNNTDDNLTDGDLTASNSTQSHSTGAKIKQPKKQRPKKTEHLVESENESGVDVRSPSDKSSQSSGVMNENGEWKRNSDDIKEALPNSTEATESSILKEQPKQKRPSIFSNSKLFKTKSLFYRRHQSKLGEVAQSPSAKRSRAKTLATVSTAPANEDSAKEEKLSSSSKSEKRKKQRRRAKRTQQGRRMMLYLKKIFYLMMICVITDVIATVLQDVIDVPELVYVVIFDLNLMVNLICIILSFRDWDTLLLPLCTKGRPRKDSVTYDSNKASVKRNNVAEKLRRANADTADFSSDTNAGAIQYHRKRIAEQPASFSTSSDYPKSPNLSSSFNHAHSKLKTETTTNSVLSGET